VPAKSLKDVAGLYRRHDGEFTVTVVDDRLELKVVHIDEKTGEVEAEDLYPLVAVGERRYQVPDGQGKGSTVDFIEYEGYGATQHFLRMGGRLSERTDESAKAKAKAPAKKSAPKDKKSKSTGKKK
jgi:hypothetical protein